MSLLSAGALGVYRDLTATSERLVVGGSVASAGAVGTRRTGTATAKGSTRTRSLARVPAPSPALDAGADDGQPAASGTADPALAPPADPAAPADGPAVAAGAPSGDEVDAGSVASFGQLLTAQIPSEALLAYTTLLALFSAGGGGYVAGRWVLYALSLPACAVVVVSAYLVRRGYDFEDTPQATGSRGIRLPRHLPWFPMAASTASMAVYGLSVPGSALQASISGPAFAITSGCLAVGGGLMMSVLAPLLGKGNDARTRPAAL
jgi:hypothetical protein